MYPTFGIFDVDKVKMFRNRRVKFDITKFDITSV